MIEKFRGEDAVVFSKKVVHFITVLIVLNFVVLIQYTRGVDTSLVENIILAFFVTEVILKMIAMSAKGFWKLHWNKFDLFIVVIGLLPLLGLPLPEGLSSLRALRLLKIANNFDATRDIVEAIARSATKMGGVLVITMLFLVVWSLMATMAFQYSIPEHFGYFFASVRTLLQMSAFDDVGSILSLTYEINPFATVLIFGLFFATVPFLTLNMIIGILSTALESDSDALKVSKEHNETMQKRMDKQDEELQKIRHLLTEFMEESRKRDGL